MTAKRPPLALDAKAFAAEAIPQPDPVKVATSMQHPMTDASPISRERSKPTARTSPTQPSRAGKVQVVAWVTEDRRAEMKIVAAKLRRSVDDLLSSMIDDLVKKHLDG